MSDPINDLRKLLDSHDPEDFQLFKTTEAADAVWLRLIELLPDRRAEIALHKRLPSVVLSKLASDADPRVRSTIAMKRRLPAEVFEMLASDSEASVRNLLACNRKLPRPILERLTRDPEQFVSDSAKRRLADEDDARC